MPISNLAMSNVGRAKVHGDARFSGAGSHQPMGHTRPLPADRFEVTTKPKTTLPTSLLFAGKSRTATRLPGQELLVQSFNMLFFNPSNHRITPQAKKDVIAAMMKQKVGGGDNSRLPDILLLQEVHSREALRDFLKEYNLDADFPNMAFFDPWQINDEESQAKAGMAVLTRSGIEITESRRLSDDLSPKPVGETVLNIDGEKKLRVYNVHPLATNWSPDPKIARKEYRRAASVRLFQFERLRDHLRGIVKKEPDADVIVAGDFNIPNQGELRRIKKVLGEVGLKRINHPDIPYTHLWRNEILGDQYQKLDFIFYRPGRYLSTKKEGGILSRPDGNPFSYKVEEPGKGLVELDASDHFPFWTRFFWGL